MAVRCPLCFDDDTRFITGSVRFNNKADIYSCNKCSLLFLDQNSYTLPDDFYETDYHQTYLAHIEPSLLNPSEYFDKMVKATRPWSDRINAILTGKETLLDFGCSTGHLLYNIKERCGQAYGHELSRREVEFCRNVKELDVSSEPLDSRFPEEFFDYITMIFVLEHIAKPQELLSYLKKFLKPDGKLLILVPNAQDPLVSFYDIPEFRSFYFCVEHLFYYNPQTIQQLFAQAGLTASIETIQEYPVANHLNWIYRQRPSDTLKARQGVPDIAIRNDGLAPAWGSFWADVNERYQEFLKAHGYGDRIWCEVWKTTT